MAQRLAGLQWSRLLSRKRLPRAGAKEQTPDISDAPRTPSPDWLVVSRTATERDFDRILFATPTRRLGDKTQVFPLERNESVRNRLTHSHEVANIARSIGTHLIHSPLGQRIVEDAVGGDCSWTAGEAIRAVPAILAAAGLAHDLGNPPFGHQGEEAIRDWVVANDAKIFGVPEQEKARIGEAGRGLILKDLERLTPSQRDDFRYFEGNAQTLRTLTKLQVVKDNRGLNLTFGTLGALMKYTVASDQVRKSAAASEKKVGYFSSEAATVRAIREELGLLGTIRHPLTYIMEACDDIAYLIVDAEDAVKKQIVSFHDLMAWLKSQKSVCDDELAKWVLDAADAGEREARKAALPPTELNDVAMQIFRANAITAMVSAVIRAFEENYEAIMTEGLDKPLIELSRASTFAASMKSFDRLHAYQHRRVLEVELQGHNTISALLNMLWRGITERADFEDVASPRTSPFARYAYGRISENYRRVFERRLPGASSSNEPNLPIRYRELQLLTDMVAGMTDQFALDLHRELQGFESSVP